MAARGSVRTYLEYGLVRSLTALLGSIPRPAAVAIGRRFALLAYHVLGRLRRIGEHNLHIAFPELDGFQRTLMLRRSFDSLGRQFGEFCHFPSATVESLRDLVEYDAASLERLEAARSLGCGMIFVTAHIGGWEVLALAHSALTHPISILARPIENPLIDRWVHVVRTRFGNQIIDKKGAGLACMRILKQGGTLGILSDLNSLPQEGVFIPFFGKLACTTLAVAALALASGATVFPVFAPWNKERKKYLLCGGPAIDVLHTGDRDRDLEINTARVASVIERAIRAYPEQWLWIHDRWHALQRPGDRVCTDFPPVGQ